jgi:hypothetical protein
MFGRAQIETWFPIPEDVSMERRVALIEKNQDLLREKLRAFELWVHTGLEDQSEAVRREAQIREEETKTVRQELAAAQTGDLYLLIIGVIWLVCGLIMSTTSIELARWLIKWT